MVSGADRIGGGVGAEPDGVLEREVNPLPRQDKTAGGLLCLFPALFGAHSGAP
jgi:hypothetical protein